MLIEIKSWVNGTILHQIEADSVKAAIEALVKQGASLYEANLYGANLNRASLNGASLNRANLNGASLNRASLNEASLYGASLNGASLNGASLNRANLNGASLNRANLNRASLYGASLNGASLYGANLNRASLYGASLYDLSCLTDLSDAIDIAPLVWQEWEEKGIEKARARFGLYKIYNEERALIAMCPRLQGGYAFILPRREIWWWSWSCPNPETVPVLWREGQS